MICGYVLYVLFNFVRTGILPLRFVGGVFLTWTRKKSTQTAKSIRGIVTFDFGLNKYISPDLTKKYNINAVVNH